MLQRLVQSADDPQRHHRRQVLREVVLIGGGRDVRQDLPGTLVAAHLHAGLCQHGAEAREHLPCFRFRHQQAFHRAAGAVTLGLGVIGDGHRLVRVRMAVHIDMAYPVQVLDHRHPGFLADPFDESLAPARDDHVDIFIEGQHGPDRGPVRGFDHLYRRARQPGGLQAIGDARGDGAVGMDRFRAAPEDHRVAGFDAQPCGIRGHVGPGLVDDPHHAQRHPHAPHLDPGRAVIHSRYFPDGVGQAGNLRQAVRHGLQPRRRQFEPVEQRVCQAVFPRRDEIRAVCLGQAGALRQQAFGDGAQRGVFFPCRSPRHGARRGPSGAAH